MKKLLLLFAILILGINSQAQIVTISKIGNGILISNVNGTTDYYLTTLSQVNVSGKMITFYSYGFPDPVRVWYDNISANFGLPTATLYVDSLNSLGYFPNTEADPIFINHLAYDITGADTTRWGAGGTGLDSTRIAFLDKGNEFTDTTGAVYHDSLPINPIRGTFGLENDIDTVSLPSVLNSGQFWIPIYITEETIIDSIGVKATAIEENNGLLKIHIYPLAIDSDQPAESPSFRLFSGTVAEGLTNTMWAKNATPVKLQSGTYWVNIECDSIISCTNASHNIYGGLKGDMSGPSVLFYDTDSIPIFSYNVHYPVKEHHFAIRVSSIDADSLSIGGTPITEELKFKAKDIGVVYSTIGITQKMLASQMRYSQEMIVDITANPQIASGYDGQIITIIGTSSYQVILENGTGLILTGGSISLANGAVIRLMYNSKLSAWMELFRYSPAE